MPALGYGKHPLLAVFIAAGIVSQSTLSRFEESGNIDFLSRSARGNSVIYYREESAFFSTQ